MRRLQHRHHPSQVGITYPERHPQHRCVATSQERRHRRLSTIIFQGLPHQPLLGTVLLHRIILGPPPQLRHTPVISALTWAVIRGRTLHRLQPLHLIVMLPRTIAMAPNSETHHTISPGTIRTGRMPPTTHMSCLATTRMHHTRTPGPSPGTTHMRPTGIQALPSGRIHMPHTTDPMTQDQWLVTTPLEQHLLHLIDHPRAVVI